MTNKFIKGYDKPFFDGFVPLKPLTYTIVIVYMDGYSTEIPGIEYPWAYMNKLKHNVNIKISYIKT